MASLTRLSILLLLSYGLSYYLCNAVISDSVLWGWGLNDAGQLGISGNTSKMLFPTHLVFFDHKNVTNITVSQGSIFLNGAGGTFSQGNNNYGQLALGYSSTKQPTTDPALNAYINPTVEVYIAGDSVNARRGPNSQNPKTLMGWGYAAGWVLGGPSNGAYAKPYNSSVSYGFDGVVEAVGTSFDAVYVAVTNGSVYSAGVGAFNALGTGSTQLAPIFKEVTFFRLNSVRVSSFVQGQSNYTCAIAMNGSLYCWGQNYGGQLGVNDTTDRLMPTRVSFFDTNGYILAKVQLGKSHTVALTCGGSVFTWGTNEAAQQGMGTQNSTVFTTPQMVQGLSGYSIVDIVTGQAQTFARATTLDWFVWGSNVNASLGTGGNNNILSPTINVNFKNFSYIFSSSMASTMIGLTGIPAVNQSCPVLVNECLGPNNCSSSAICTDTERSYTCSCPAGWPGNGQSAALNGTGCYDPGACGANSKCVAMANCSQTGSSFTCTCPSGYSGDGMKNGTGCQDINECQVGGYCSANSNCTNYPGNYSCSCNPGFYGDGQQNGTQCTAICSNGTYAMNQSTCAPCPNGTYSTSSQALSCTPCPVGTYNGLLGANSPSYCLACPQGMYSQQGSDFCFPCPTGQTTNTNSATGPRGNTSFCQACPMGTQGYYGLCTACPAGYFGNTTGASVCYTCPPGSYSGSPGSTSCTTCAAGTYSWGGISSCTNCSVGYASAAGSSTCFKCGQGTGTGGMPGQTSCTTCPAGSYQGTVAGGQCYLCPKGYFSSQPGSAQCTRCTPGTYTSAPGATSCTSCALNTYASAVASTACTACLAGTSTPATGSNQCAPCPVGTYRAAGMSACSPCPSGQFMNIIGATSCYTCNPGTYYSSNGATYCMKCPVNTYSNATTGYTSCTACPSGTSSYGGASGCQ